MSKKKSGGIYIERELYQSPAFLNLHNNAKTMLIALLDARMRERPLKDKGMKKTNRRFVNLDRIEMPYKTLIKRYGMNKQGITRAIDKLLANGFISITHQGGLGEHDKSRYALISDYLLWKPGTVFRHREQDVKRGYQGKRLGATKKVARKIIPPYAHQTHTLLENSRAQNHTPEKTAVLAATTRN